MRFVSRSLLLKLGIVTVMICLGATAMSAWHTNKVENKPAPAAASMSIWDLHNNAHMDNLPVQRIDSYN